MFKTMISILAAVASRSLVRLQAGEALAGPLQKLTGATEGLILLCRNGVKEIRPGGEVCAIHRQSEPLRVEENGAVDGREKIYG